MPAGILLLLFRVAWRVEAEGTLEMLLESCEEMQRLWHGDVQ